MIEPRDENELRKNNEKTNAAPKKHGLLHGDRIDKAFALLDKAFAFAVLWAYSNVSEVSTGPPMTCLVSRPPRSNLGILSRVSTSEVQPQNLGGLVETWRLGFEARRQAPRRREVMSFAGMTSHKIITNK